MGPRAVVGQGSTIGNRMINARAETLTEKGAFKNLVDRRRCLVPADGFYEWRKERKRKVPYAVLPNHCLNRLFSYQPRHFCF
jgi:putative SOS response-associated peptidase YedK